MTMRLIILISFVATLLAVHKCAAADCVAVRLPQQRAIPGVAKMWGETGKFWPNGSTLNVGWIGGTTRQRSEAWKRFQQIDALTGLQFTKTLGVTQIRVSFDLTKGHWSYVGRDNLAIAATKPTMNLALEAGIFGDHASEWQRVALHEICHAIGLSHEHNHPQAGIPWNVPKVIAYYRQTQGWSEAQTRYQVLNRYTGSQFNGTAYDKDSLMQYPVEPSLTTNGFYVDWNRKLSPMDISFLSRIYPLK